MKRCIGILQLFLILQFAAGCGNSGSGNKGGSEFEENPPAEGFDIQGSDPQAIKIADDVMGAMGGRRNWDNTRYLTWNFFGSRRHVWDKWTGDVRIEGLRDSTVVLMNINTMEGRVMKAGEEVIHPDSLQTYLEKGKRWWINDSYWLVMPFKLKDSGVTLSYLREDTTLNGKDAYVLGLNFEAVGVTPDNRYEVYVDVDSRLVTQWAYFREADQLEPNFVMPWLDYKPYGGILLSGNRGERQITGIAVLESAPEDIFSNFSTTNF